MRDSSLYHSVLAAVAEGNNTTGGIASYIGRKSNEVAHPLRSTRGLPAADQRARPEAR